MPEQRISTDELAYAAGFFDGEGYIGICGAIKGKNNSLCLEVDVTQVDPRPLQWLAERFGGVVKSRIRNQYISTRNNRKSFIWRLYANEAVSFLKLVHPFLIVKKDQADLAIQFQKIVCQDKYSKVAEKVAPKLEIRMQLKALKKNPLTAVA